MHLEIKHKKYLGEVAHNLRGGKHALHDISETIPPRGDRVARTPTALSSASPPGGDIVLGAIDPHGSLSSFLGIDPMSQECYEFAGFRFFPKQRALLLGGERVAIGGRAFDLLLLLVSRAGSVVSSREIMQIVWPNISVEEANLRVQIGILRKALSQCEEAKGAIDTIPLRGYCFVLPVRHSPVEIQPSGFALKPRCALPNLPHPPIGRDETISMVQAALHQRRFVTITGPGGIGKTTVAIAAAKQYAEGFSGNIIFIDLSNVTDGAEIAQVVGDALQLAPNSDPLDALCDYFCFREFLLILDTCEHVIESVAIIAEDLLSRCTDLKILVTSREILRASGEWTYRLLSLTFPDDETVIEPADMANFSAISLFMDRVQTGSQFQPEGQDLPIIAEICRRLDGIPLALEFAAARVTDLGLRKIAAHLNDCFTILTRDRRTALPRHRTLSATFEWSYSLLSDEEQIMLSYLAALAGPFTVERAVSCYEAGNCEKPSETFYGLYDKSLLSTVTINEEPMFRLLNVTRSFVLGKTNSPQSTDLPSVGRP